MAKQTDKTYWFRAKKYGWGWGFPLTWQGWVSFGLFLLVWLVALMALVLPSNDELQIPTANLVWFAVVMVADVAAFAYVSFKYGEPPKWRWGNKHGGSKKSKSD